MYVTDSFVYLQLQKTACTHIARLLGDHCPGKQIGKHNRLGSDLIDSGRKIVGSIRNPWDWYVSLWTFGCRHKGGLYGRVTTRVEPYLLRSPLLWPKALSSFLKKPVGEWRACYADRNDPGLFHRWQRMMFDPPRAGDLGEGYGDSSLKTFAGFFTYRYLRLFAGDGARLFDGSLTDHAGLRTYASENNLMDHVIRNERLEDDLLEVLRALGSPASPQQESQMRSTPRTNASVRNRDYSKYYDAESAQLVADREQLIVAMYGYQSPVGAE